MRGVCIASSGFDVSGFVRSRWDEADRCLTIGRQDAKSCPSLKALLHSPSDSRRQSIFSVLFVFILLKGGVVQMESGKG